MASSNMMIMKFAFPLFAVTCTALLMMIRGAPVTSDTTSTLQAMNYLTKFGYIEPSSSDKYSSLLTEDSLRVAIREFQRFAGLNQTGIVDNETAIMMNTPRCGVKDKVGHGTNARRKRYALQGSRWRVKELTYKISKYPAGGKLTKNTVDNELSKSFKVWSDYTDLKFVQKSAGKVHIEVRFERGEHGDGDPFDGPGGTLAHAYFPMYGGDAHFDDSEQWTINSYRGTNLFQVAAHEFGHSLGLSHSDSKGALMAPFYQKYTSNFQLPKDDISAIQALYGRKVGGTEDNEPAYNPPFSPPSKDEGHEEGELCSDSSIDTIFQSEGKTFAFKGDYYWGLTDVGLADGYPRSISKDFRGLPSNLDAAFSWSNGKTYFFKGKQYWRFTGQKMDPDYPQAIQDGFPGIPNDLDSAFVWSGNGKIFFFKGANYWRFDHEQLPPVSDDYPKPVSSWEGIPNDIDAAFQWSNGYTYFFKGTYYWRFNDRTFSVDYARPPFPRSSAVWWFGCKSMTENDDPNAGLKRPHGHADAGTGTGSADTVGTAASHASLVSADRSQNGAKDDVEYYQPDAEDGNNKDRVHQSAAPGSHIGSKMAAVVSTLLTLFTSLVLLRQ